MNLQPIVEEARKLAESEINLYGLPTMLHLQLSVDKGREIARHHRANEDLVLIGVYLMDVKLGQAFKENRLVQHIQMGIETAQRFVTEHDLKGSDAATIMDAVASHHGTPKFVSLESEIVANADCYRFIHPVGVFHYISTLVKRGMDHNAVLAGAEAKLDEKTKILSLEYCKLELNSFVVQFKTLFATGRI